METQSNPLEFLATSGKSAAAAVRPRKRPLPVMPLAIGGGVVACLLLLGVGGWAVSASMSSPKGPVEAWLAENVGEVQIVKWHQPVPVASFWDHELAEQKAEIARVQSLDTMFQTELANLQNGLAKLGQQRKAAENSGATLSYVKFRAPNRVGGSETVACLFLVERGAAKMASGDQMIWYARHRCPDEADRAFLREIIR